jgi:O-antigen/teichoic acid export membrane protein
VGRNSFLNFIGQGVPLVVGVLLLPFMVRGLGVDRYGLLSLAWVILGYFTAFDLGMGRAITKYVAEALSTGQEDEVPRLVWTAVTVQFLFGLVCGTVLASITPLLTERIVKFPAEMIGEARSTFYLLAVAIPVVLVSSSFSGVLEAALRFDLVNAVKVPSGLLTFILPALGMVLGFRLPGIVLLMFLGRAISCVALLSLAFRVFPNLRELSASFDVLKRLFAYGGWITVAGTIHPIFVYLDRFLIGSFLTISAVAFYTAPYEAITRLWIVPASLSTALFPTFSSLEGLGDQEKLGMLFVRSVKFTFLVLAPVVLVVVLFSPEILQIFLGADFAVQSALVLRILAVGVLINSLAQTPYALLQGVGRPDLTAKFHLLELPLYVATLFMLLGRWGIAGAALAWTLRAALDTLLLFAAAFKVCRLSPRLFTAANRLVRAVLILLLLGGAGYGLKTFAGALPLFLASILSIIVFCFSAFVVWRNVLDASDRGALIRAIRL